MKVALLFSGLVRNLDQVWPRIQTIYARYQPDIYYYLNEPDKQDLVRELLSPTLILAEPDQTFPENNYASRMGSGSARDGVHSAGIQSHLRQFHGLLRVNQLRKSTNIRYDWVVRLRTDLEFIRDPESLESLDPHFLYIPKFANWYGYNDRFAMGPPDLMDIYMERFPFLELYFNEGGVFHAESFLAWHLRRNHVPVARTNVAFNLLRANGDRDPIFWGRQWCDVD